MKIPVPKNWKVTRRSFASITWQQGQKRCICEKGGQPKYDGWKWTTGVQVTLRFDEGDRVWKVTLIRPLCPIVTTHTDISLDRSLEYARNTMNLMNIRYPEEEYGSINS